MTAAKLSIPKTAERLTLYHDTEDYLDQDIDVEVVVVIPEKIPLVKGLTVRYLEAEPEMASILVYGPFEMIDGVYHSLARWLNDHPDYVINGITRQLPINGPWNRQSPEDYLTELQIPIKKRVN